MKKHRPARPQPRRKPIRRPLPQKLPELDGIATSSPAELPRLLNMLDAVGRAQRAMMPAAELAEFDQLSRADTPETPAGVARLDALMAAYKPTKAQIAAALAEIEAEQEAASSGDFATDVQRASEIAQAAMREYMTPEEAAEWAAASAALEAPGSGAAEERAHATLLRRFLPRVPELELADKLQRAGVSPPQIAARYLDSAPDEVAGAPPP